MVWENWTEYLRWKLIISEDYEFVGLFNEGLASWSEVHVCENCPYYYFFVNHWRKLPPIGIQKHMIKTVSLCSFKVASYRQNIDMHWLTLNSSMRKLVFSQLNSSKELNQFSVLISSVTWYLSASISTYPEYPSLSGLKNCVWLKHMAPK